MCSYNVYAGIHATQWKISLSSCLIFNSLNGKIKTFWNFFFHLHLHISHWKCQLICGRCYVSLYSYIQMHVLNGEVDYFQRIFREFPSPDTHGNQFWLVCLIDINNLEGRSAKQFGTRHCPKGTPNPLRCQVLLWNAEVILLYLACQLFILGWKDVPKWLSAPSPTGGAWMMEVDEVLHQIAEMAMRMELCRAGFSTDTLQHSQLWVSKIQCFDPKSFEILGRLAIRFTGLWIKPYEMCTALLKGFCINCVHANHTRGLLLPVCFGFDSCIPLREKYCRIWEMQQKWEAEGTLPSQPPSSFQNPFDVSPRSQKFPGSPLFGF